MSKFENVPVEDDVTILLEAEAMLNQPVLGLEMVGIMFLLQIYRSHISTAHFRVYPDIAK